MPEINFNPGGAASLNESVRLRYEANADRNPFTNAWLAKLTALPTAATLAADLDGKAAVSHTHAIANVTGLQVALDGKAATGHTHAIANVTGLQVELDGKAAAVHTHALSQILQSGATPGQVAQWDGSAWVPVTITAEGGGVISVNGLEGVVVLTAASVGAAATVHTHAIANVTGLQVELDGKAASSHTHAIGNVTGLQAELDGKAASSHTHTLANLSQSGATTGQVVQWNGSAWAPVTITVEGGGVVSVNGQEGVVVLTAASVGAAAASHAHAIADVTGLQAALDAKLDEADAVTVATKTTPVTGDFVLITDGAASDAPKRVAVGFFATAAQVGDIETALDAILGAA